MARTLSLAACQFEIRPVRDFEEFAGHVRALLDGARGADLVLFPELFTIELFTSLAGWQKAPLSDLPQIDRYTRDYRDLFVHEARARGQVILAGSHLVQAGGRPLNERPGAVTVDRYYAVDDVGLAINPLICEGQVPYDSRSRLMPPTAPPGHGSP